MYDLAIIGGGPAGASAGIYAARKKLKTVFITKDFGGQSIVASDIQNWLGTESVSGKDFGKMVENHVRSYSNESLKIEEGRYAESLKQTTDNTFILKTDDGKEYESRAILICTGGRRRKLNVAGSEKFENKGITYCATCDAPMFSGQKVAVVGGGNAGFGTASQLTSYAKEITILNNSDKFMADPLRVEEVLRDPKVKALNNADVKEIKGDKMVSALIYENKETGELCELDVTGIFVEIGMIPATDIVKKIVELDDRGYIIVNHKNQKTSVQGIWAAGDCTDSPYKQNIIAAGAGATALEDIYYEMKLS